MHAFRGMVMDKVRDYLSSCVIADGKVLDGYSKIYFKTNEDLVNSYRLIDFKDKEVFSVLGSSDQVFMARSLGAKKVDSFDKNPLAIYYYYLRCWTIKYRNRLYPEAILDNDYKWLKSLLSMVKPQSKEEEDALHFWIGHLNRKTNLEYLFFDDSIVGNVTIPNDDKSIASWKMDFQVIDLFKENEFDSSYDIVILSNIIEWAKGSRRKITCVRDNLDKLLKQGGIALCSKLIRRYPEMVYEEREIFDSSFDFFDYDDRGYVYQKK